MRGPRDRGGARFDSVWTSASLAADGRLLVLSVAEYVVFVSDLLYSRRVEIVQITLYLHKGADINVLQYEAKQCLWD